MPQAVEIPAPVKATKWDDVSTISANRVTFSSSTAGSSKYSFISSSVLCAVYAILSLIDFISDLSVSFVFIILSN